jgi:hypothetical protein
MARYTDQKQDRAHHKDDGNANEKYSQQPDYLANPVASQGDKHSFYLIACLAMVFMDLSSILGRAGADNCNEQASTPATAPNTHEDLSPEVALEQRDRQGDERRG